MSKPSRDKEFSGFIEVRGAAEHNLKAVNVRIPRDALVVFTGISGSGKSSLAFGTLYAEAQRRYLDSVSPYARRLFNQMQVPKVDQIDGLPPAVALQQQRGTVSTRSSVGSITTIANLLRMLYSRAGDYPDGQSIIYAEGFSPNTPEGACPHCHGLGRVYEVTERSMVPDESLTIRERAIAAWPPAWQGQNQRDILTTLGYDVDIPWKDLPQQTRDWILFTEEQPVVPVYANRSREAVQEAIRKKITPDYMGTFTSVQRYVMQTFATTQSPLMKKRVAQYMLSSECKVCQGKRLKQESLSVTFAGLDIADMGRISLEQMATLFSAFLNEEKPPKSDVLSPEKLVVADRIAEDLLARLRVILDLGLGYLTLERTTPTLSPGELQRLRLATQVYSNLFGVVYVLDEPSAGLHPADTEALLRTLDQLKAAGNSLFVVEHEPEVIQHADWIVDVGPAAGESGGQVLYSGPPAGLKNVAASVTRNYIFDIFKLPRYNRQPTSWLKLAEVTRNNLDHLAVDFPLGVFTCVTGVSGSGKSSLVSQVLVELVANALGTTLAVATDVEDENPLEQHTVETLGGTITEGMSSIKRLIVVDQKPIGRTPRSNLATYTGLFDAIRKLFAATKMAKARKYDAGRFSFNVAKGRCPHCQGEGSVMVELLFLPSVYAPCPACQGKRYNPETLEVKYNTKDIADVLAMTVDEAFTFFKDNSSIAHGLGIIREVGLGYLRLGQPATELSGGEAQRIKLATELQRPQQGSTLYILDEPTTGLHPADIEKLMIQLQGLVQAGNTVLVIEHDMSVAAASDWVIDMGPGAGNQGGKVVAQGVPERVAQNAHSRTAPYLARYLD